MSNDDDFEQAYSEKEQRYYEELEQERYDEIFFRFEKSIENFQNVSKETLANNLRDIENLIEIISKYEVWLLSNYPYRQEKTLCFFIKLSEISATLDDILFLVTIGMYNASRILIRKFMELSIISIHMDTKETDEGIKKLWIDNEDMKSSGFGWRLKQLKMLEPKDLEGIYQIYKELSIYVHNEGKDNLYILYDENQFSQIFKIICEVDELIQKVLDENYKDRKK